MVVVLAAPGALLIAVIGLAAILAIYHRRRKRNLRHQSSQSAQPNVPVRDVEDAHDGGGGITNYTQTKNGSKQPDLIKSKQGKSYPTLSDSHRVTPTNFSMITSLIWS